MTDLQRANAAAIELLGESRVCLGAQAARYAFNGRAPQLIVFPESPEELSALLRHAREAKLGVIPWGGGTKQHLGYLPTRFDWVVDLSRFSGVSEHQEADFVVSVRAGTPLREVNEFLRRFDQRIPLDPLEGDSATLGGIAAANASGPLRLGFGTPRDLILGMEVVMADGTPVRFGAKVVKSVAGYDLNKLYVGSLGTLGFITEVTLKTSSTRVLEGSLWAVYRESGTLQALSNRILAERILPASLEWLTGGGFAIPPPLRAAAESGHALMVGFLDNAPGVAAQLDKVEAMLADGTPRALVRFGPEEARETREALSDSGPFHGSSDGLGFAARMGVPLTRMGESVERMRVLGSSKGFAVACQAHAGSGIVRAWFGWTGEADPPGMKTRAGEVVHGLQEAAKRVGGYAVIETRALELRESLDLWNESSVGPVGLALMKRAKKALDPNGILNPGRFFGRI